MKLPDIILTVPVPYEREYAASATATTPSYKNGLKEMETDVSPEYVAFLINEHELDMDDYVDLVFEHMLNNDAGFQAEFDEVVEAFNEDISEKMLKIGIITEIMNQIDQDDTGWSDWV